MTFRKISGQYLAVGSMLQNPGQCLFHSRMLPLLNGMDFNSYCLIRRQIERLIRHDHFSIKMSIYRHRLPFPHRRHDSLPSSIASSTPVMLYL